MSDYSFMKTGFSNTVQPINDDFEDQALLLLSLFSSNALQNAAKHVELCKRDGVRKEDVIYGLKYEVFEFLRRPNIQEEIQKIKEELEEYSSDEDEDYEDVESININNPHIVPDDELNNFKRMDKSQISSLNETDQEFISKFYNYSDTWDSWEPETPFEKILKSSINSSNNIY